MNQINQRRSVHYQPNCSGSGDDPQISIWNDLTRQVRLHLPTRVRDLVALETSMTERIGTVANRPVDVEVLRQTKGRLHADERGFFPSATDVAVVREVCLSAGRKPLLIARSVFSSHRLQTHPTILALGTKPLGALLFADGRPGLHTAREFARIGPDMPLFALVRKRHRGLQSHYWGRRTLYHLFGAPILVTEIFLPELIHHPAARRSLLGPSPCAPVTAPDP